jgi:diguanylate cyclase (GGDEF)-like protein
LSVGIAGRLAISFAAVATLAAAANLLIEHGAAVIHTRRLDAEFSPIPKTVAPPAVDTASPKINSAPAASAAPSRPIDVSAALAQVEQFVKVVDRFHHAVDARVALDSSESMAEVEQSRNELEAAARDLQSSTADKPHSAASLSVGVEHGGATLDQSLSSYAAAATAMVQAADAGRFARRAYSLRIEVLERRINASMDRAWKMFGRVLARQSLMRLHTDLEELRRRASALGAPDTYDSSAIDTAAASERTLAAAVDSDAVSLTRTEGAEWVRQVRDDIAETAALRESILQGDKRLKESTDRFAETRSALVAAIPRPKIAAAAPRAMVRPPAAPAEIATPTAPVQSAAAVLPPAAPALAAVVTTARVPDEHERRTDIALITAAVLAVLLTVSMLTVRSISTPVSRMLAATRKLAGGDVTVRVPRGGIKELDTLAVAFNRMAAQLAAARAVTQDYRQHLETQVEQRTRQLQHLAEHDPLTLLPNRRRFFVLLDQALRWAAENRRTVVVFFIDIDNFKNLNDSLGHAFGDRVLICVAQRLEEAASSIGFAARLGGDEFTVVHTDAVSGQAAQDAGRRLVHAFQQALKVDGREVTVSVSVGASLYPDHELHAEDLLSAADAALFRAKALGRNQLVIYTPELLETVTHKFTTEQGVRRALEHDEFELVFQPEVSLESLEVGLVETLLRWRLPDGRRASPAEFLAVTEESGLIIELGNWVLRKAFATAAGWHHGLWRDVKIAINVSPRQVADPRFVESVQKLLKEFKLPPRCIELELTESVLQTGPATIESLRQLRSLDIAIALDDFGTGYSSLASLEQLPLTRIKLDRTLIASIDSNARSAAITAALITLCEGLGLEVTAEGVERPPQFRALAGNRALYLQGYLISRPVEADEILHLKTRMPQLMHDLLLASPREPLGSTTELSKLGYRQIKSAGT